ncbi:hypothetical protein [Streptosporangium sp. NPDC002524]|uniref:hypothetical protein n=1 Tax=Streptosporangium sp. NPDC002524 TaxID=3154537 RepID=UPI00332DC1ED
MTDTETETYPYRVVDGRGDGWLSVKPHTEEDKALGVPVVYQGRPGQPNTTLEALTAERGPVRPVVLPSDDDDEALRQALTGAGRKAAGTLAAALYRVACKASDAAGRRAPDLLVAGRPGSWESASMRQLTWEIGSDIKPKWVDAAALGVLEEILTRWVLSPDSFVEVAENLASVFGPVVDAAGGWEKVADQWLVAADAKAGGAFRNYLASCADTYGPSSW